MATRHWTPPEPVPHVLPKPEPEPYKVITYRHKREKNLRIREAAHQSRLSLNSFVDVAVERLLEELEQAGGES